MARIKQRKVSALLTICSMKWNKVIALHYPSFIYLHNGQSNFTIMQPWNWFSIQYASSSHTVKKHILSPQIKSTQDGLSWLWWRQSNNTHYTHDELINTSFLYEKARATNRRDWLNRNVLIREPIIANSLTLNTWELILARSSNDNLWGSSVLTYEATKTRI